VVTAKEGAGGEKYRGEKDLKKRKNRKAKVGNVLGHSLLIFLVGNKHMVARPSDSHSCDF
jgi:hypothetical protein